MVIQIYNIPFLDTFLVQGIQDGRKHPMFYPLKNLKGFKAKKIIRNVILDLRSNGKLIVFHLIRSCRPPL